MAQTQPQAQAQAQAQDPPMVTIQKGQLDRLGVMVRLMGAQNASAAVEKFSGDPKKFSSWVKSIEKYLMVVGGDKESMKTFALQSSEGSVSDFLLRYYQEKTDCNWADIFGELKSRFGEVVDSQHALQMMRSTRQKTGESIAVYAERLLRTADDVWPDSDLKDPLIEQQMVGVFTDGLIDNGVARKVMRENCEEFKTAVQIAMQEEKMGRRFELRHRHVPRFKQTSNPRTSQSKAPVHDDRDIQPMDVDAFHGRCYKCGRKGHRAVDCRMKRVQEVRSSTLTCFKCGQTGHGLNTCVNRGVPQTGRCWCCGSKDHRQAQCPKTEVMQSNSSPLA